MDQGEGDLEEGREEVNQEEVGQEEVDQEEVGQEMVDQEEVDQEVGEQEEVGQEEEDQEEGRGGRLARSQIEMYINNTYIFICLKLWIEK